MFMKNVIVYSTETCPYCVLVKDYLKEKGITYAEKNVGTDLAAREEMMKKASAMSVPVVDIDGTIILGFDKTKINQALGIVE